MCVIKIQVELQECYCTWSSRSSWIKRIIKRHHWDQLKPTKLKTLRRNKAKNTEPDSICGRRPEEGEDAGGATRGLHVSAHGSGVMGQTIRCHHLGWDQWSDANFNLPRLRPGASKLSCKTNPRHIKPWINTELFHATCHLQRALKPMTNPWNHLLGCRELFKDGNEGEMVKSFATAPKMQFLKPAEHKQKFGAPSHVPPSLGRISLAFLWQRDTPTT